MKLAIDDRFCQQLPPDPVETNSRRQVMEAAFSYVAPKKPTEPRLLHASTEVADLLGLTADDLSSQQFLDVFSGAKKFPQSRPFAMCYGGHQFGSWAGQLGDGRAINLMEIEHRQQHWMLQLKGAGPTPYSRTADGLAVLRSSLREHLCSEAMFHLGVPTTRSLCLIATGDQVMRDVMYDGHPKLEPGAVVCRVAPSFIRFGSFEIFASRHDVSSLRKLTDYTIRHHFPDIDVNDGDRYGRFFHTVCQTSLDMVLHWQRVGFVHGVMNTDNMSIHGDTIDYGPYGWLEGFDPDWTPNTTDAGRGRYRYGNQPAIVLWNLVRLANALYALVEDAEPFEDALQQFQTDFQTRITEMRTRKLGLDQVRDGDLALVESLEKTLQRTETDMTIFYRLLADVDEAEMVHETDFLSTVAPAFYVPEELTGETRDAWRQWFRQYADRLKFNASPAAQRRAAMNLVNPRYVLRNYMAQLAIDKATHGDKSLIDELHEVLKRPYDEQPDHDQWFARRPDWAREKVGCSMLSCSS